MNERKRENYKRELNNNGIDTLSGLVRGNKTPTRDISININQINYRAKEDSTYIFVNPNKSDVGEKLINTYSDFVAKMDGILTELDTDPNDFNLIRADFCFNSMDSTSFKEYQKLHRLIISCLAKAYNYKNCYVSSDLWNCERLSVAIKKDDSEAENYDKKRQSNGTDESANRLELRSKRLRDNGDYRAVIVYQFLIRWFERLDNAIKCFDDVQREYNDHLEGEYREDYNKPTKERKYTLKTFLLMNTDRIYTRKQMIDLLTRLKDIGNYSNPAKRADKFKENHKIEYFSRADLIYVVDVLKEKAEEYFTN